MNISCIKSELSKALNTVSKAVSNKSTIPSLKGILLEASEDGKLILSASDNDLAIQDKIDAKIYEQGKIIIPAKLFIEMIRKLSGEEVLITTDEQNVVKIVSGNSDLTIIGMDADEFPEINEIKKERAITIKKNIFEKMVNKTSFSASLDESKGTATGILIETSDNKINMVSIDGYRMSVVRESTESNNNASIIVVARVLNEVCKILADYSDDENEMTEIIIDDNSASIKVKNTLIVMRILEGNFVNYNSILPKEFKTKLTISRESIKESIDRVSLMAREGKNNLVRLKIQDGLLLITSKADMGSIKDELIAEQEGDDIEIGFNSKYFLDAINCIEDDEVRILINNSSSPFLITPVDGDNYDYMILPIRIMV